MVQQITELTDDDLHIGTWLRSGAPAGVAAPVPPGGLLSRISEEPPLTLTDLVRLPKVAANHPSFDTIDAQGKSAVDQLQELVDAGHAILFSDLPSAERWLRHPAVPSPLGDVTKPLADGTTKHRLIMDLRASQVNASSAVSERQVLPRFSDHALDLAVATHAHPGDVSVMVLDFKNAFMTIPLAAAEQPFAVSVVPQGLARNRD